MSNHTTIGYISACIAGDYRYTTRIEVQVNGDEAFIVVTETGASGGMDGDGTATKPREVLRTRCPARAKNILAAVKWVINLDEGSTVKRYGTPAKRFQWTTWADRRSAGLSVKRVEDALAYAKECNS